MEAREIIPFRGEFGSEDGWCLNYNNYFVRKFTDADDADIEKLGSVGKLIGGGNDYALIWRIVSTAHISLSDIENEWTFDRMLSFSAYLQMTNDYKSVWQEFYKDKE